MRLSSALCLEPSRKPSVKNDFRLFGYKLHRKIRPWVRKKPTVDFRRSVDHFAIYLQSFRDDPQLARNDISQTFKTLADNWRKETRAISALKRKILHPAYQQIIGMGPSAVPLILNELSERPNDWMWALNAITHEDPAPDNANFDEAVEAWLSWGRRKHLLP
jgi:hypothetical protein